MSGRTLYDCLATLTHLGDLSNESGRHKPSLQFFDLGISGLNRFSILSKPRSRLKQAVKEIGAAVWLLVEETGKMVYLGRELGEQPIETTNNRMYTATAGGTPHQQSIEN